MHTYDVECECLKCRQQFTESLKAAEKEATQMLEKAMAKGLRVDPQAKKYVVYSIMEGRKPSEWELEQWLGAK